LSNKNVIYAHDLSFERSGRNIFSSLSFSLDVNQSLIIKGRNGSGKTSLLRCLAGFYPITSGKILWYGENILPAYYNEKPVIAWLGHFDAIKGSLTVRENLMFFLEIWSVPINTFNEVVKTFSFEKFLDFPASWLSAGEKRRLSLLRLSFCPAKVWVLDEPSTYLDIDNKRILISIMSKHINSGGSIVCATHDDFNIPNSIEYFLD
jgi:heme exporter protein A